MAVITIATGEIEEYQGTETAPVLRYFPNQTYVAANGDTIAKGTVSGTNFYGDITCSVVADVVTYPAFTLHSTTDALYNPRDAKWTFALYTPGVNGSLIQIIHKGFRIPSTPTSTSLGALGAYNQANLSAPVAGSYTTTQTDTLIAAAVAGKASLGVVIAVHQGNVAQ